MGKTNLLNTRTTNLLELVGNGRTYRVPPYQRDYSWEEEQWDDLWNDILDVRGRPDDRHYMGALVVEGKSDREFLIIDGQQRLATLSVPGGANWMATPGNPLTLLTASNNGPTRTSSKSPSPPPTTRRSA